VSVRFDSKKSESENTVKRGSTVGALGRGGLPKKEGTGMSGGMSDNERDLGFSLCAAPSRCRGPDFGRREGDKDRGDQTGVGTDSVVANVIF
jgi:hypothetical protein